MLVKRPIRITVAILHLSSQIKDHQTMIFEEDEGREKLKQERVI
jgi:hypothetical protein